MQKTLLVQQYHALKAKYLKLRQRYQRKIEEGTFASLGQQKQQSILQRLKRYQQKLTQFVAGLKGSMQQGMLGTALFACVATTTFTSCKKDNDPAPVVLNLANRVLTAVLPASSPFGNNGSVSSAVGYSATPAFGDLDGDGDLDVIVGGGFGSPNELAYYRNTGTRTAPTFTLQTGEASPLSTTTFSGYVVPTLGDIDNDGDLDLLIATGSGLKYFRNTGSRTNPIFTEQTGANNPFNALASTSFGSISLVDIDNDGDLDLFASEYDYDYNTYQTTYNIKYFRNTGTNSSPSFTEQTGANNPLDGINNGVRFAFGDVDNDGDQDFTFYNESTDVLVLYKNTGSASSASFVAVSAAENILSTVDLGSTDNYWANPAWADVDGDGDLDLFVGTYYSRLLYYKHNAR